jgi:aryl-alcohol dehydrogenase-like predicted oxidoreductase
MEQRRLGRSGLKVSAIALGTMQFGWTAGEDASYAIMDAYVEGGGNLIDTADIYSKWAPGNPGGVSEEIIGRWMKARGTRDQVLVATKVRGLVGENHLHKGLNRLNVRRACEQSLKRLQVDHIDLYQAHWIDRDTPIEETLDALTQLVRDGLVRYVGCSNFSAWRLMESLWISDKRNLARFDSLQPEYSLAQPVRANFERELAQACHVHGIGVLPYSPLAGGFLTGKYRRDQPLPESVRANGIQHSLWNDQNLDTVEKLVEIADRHDSTPGRVAIAWLLAQPFVTAPIVGANSIDQLKDIMQAAELKLTPEEVKELSTVSDYKRSRTETGD